MYMYDFNGAFSFEQNEGKFSEIGVRELIRWSICGGGIYQM